MPTIEVSGLIKSYSQLRAVDGISFTVQKGEIFSLLGPNGAGKTTTIEILEGLREKDGGKVKVLDLDPWHNGYALHKRIGVIPQGFRFFEKATPKEAIKYYADLFNVKADVNSILKEIILEDSANVYFENLSGGQKQKVGLALALVNDPELLFLDEPTTGLDAQARRAMWEVVRSLKKEGRSILLTTHYLEEAEQLADRVAIMNTGKIIASGTPNEIITQFGTGEKLTVRGNEELANYLRENTKLDITYDTNGLVSIAITQKRDALAAFATIEQSGLDWNDLRTERDSLEDIFVRLLRGKMEGGEIQEIVGHKGAT